MSKYAELEETLARWIGQLNAKHGTERDEDIKKRIQKIGQQMSTADFT